MLTKVEFYEWEKASRDTIDVKRCYIDLAGDLVSGILLSQIIYWFLPSKEGSKLRVERDGYKWLAKARTEWWDECRITRHQYIRSIKILSDKGLVSTARYKFAGRPVAHVRLNFPALLEGLQSTVTKADNLISPKRTVQSTESGQSLPETTPENTSKINSSSRNAFKLYEDNIGKLTRVVSEDISCMLEEFSDERVCDAIEIAVKAGAANLRYIRGILSKPERSGKRETGVIDSDKFNRGKYAHLTHGNRAHTDYLKENDLSCQICRVEGGSGEFPCRGSRQAEKEGAVAE